MSRLEIYEVTNFTKCLADNSYFATPEFVSKYAHIIALISIPINLFGFYCITFRTPKKMKEMKLCLLHLQFWTFLLDVGYLLFLIPFYFSPLNAYGYFGLFSEIGVSSKAQYYMDLIAGGGITAAILMLFENRHHSLVPFTSIFRVNKPSLRVFIVFLNFLLGAPGLIPTLLLENNTEEVKLEMLQIIPCPSKLFFDSKTFAVEQDNEVISFGTTIGTAIVFFEGLFYAFHCVYHLSRMQKSHCGLSDQARKMHRTFFKATCIQIMIPVAFITIPSFYMAYSMIYMYYNQGLMNILTIVTSFHGTVATLALVLVNKPYRDFVVRTFKKKERESNSNLWNQSTNLINSNKIFQVSTKTAGN